MKILIFSDLHLHNHTYGATLVDGMNSRLKDGANVLHQIAEYCENNQVDSIVFGGDLFHTHGKIEAGVLKVAYEGFKEIIDKSNVFINVLVGNHDTGVKDMSVHALHWLEAFNGTTGWPCIRVIDKPIHTSRRWPNDEPCSYLPYTENVDEIKEFFKNANEICFLHQGLDGVPMKSGFVPGSAFTYDMIPENVKHVFTGHYHPRMRVGEKATVIGSALQLNWADEGDRRGFLVYDTDTGEQEFIESKAPKFVTVDMSDGSCGFARGMQVQGNFIRVKNYAEEDKEEIREMFMESTRSVEFVVKTKQADRLRPVSDELHIPELVKKYEEQQAVTPERSEVGKELMK